LAVKVEPTFTFPAEISGSNSQIAKMSRKRPHSQIAKPDLQVWTDFSGLEAPLMALQNIGVSFRQVQACDVLPEARAFWNAHFDHGCATIYNHDITQRDLKDLEKFSVDLYVAGFPCPDYSIAGTGSGATGKTGGLMLNMVATLKVMLPHVFLLENVAGFVTQHQPTYLWLLDQLRRMGKGYWVDARILNCKDHGIPQSRPRLFIVGIQKERVPKDFVFEWPPEIGHVPLSFLLDRQTSKATVKDHPPASQTQAFKNWQTACRQIIQKLEQNPFESHICADIDGSRGPHWMDGCVPCLTRSRCGKESHWLMGRGRRLNLNETARLMGMNPKSIDVDCVTKNKMGKMLGNSMCVNVLERLLVRLLPAAGWRHLKLLDRWGSLSSAKKAAAALNA